MFDKKPPSPDLLNCDFAEIEARVAAQMTQVMGVPAKMVRHGMNAKTGTPTGRIPRDPEMQKLPTTKA